jgi:hypothetical protein
MHFISVIVLASLLFGNTVHAASAPTDSDNQGMQDIQRMMDETRNQIIQFWAQQRRLIGTWSTVNYYGHLVNPATGTIVSQHGGKWFTFDADGTYVYTLIGSGPLVSGAAVDKGTYVLNGDRLSLHQKTESFYPHPTDPSGRPMYKDRPTSENITLYVRFKGPAEMVLQKEGSTTETFRRDPNSK